MALHWFHQRSPSSVTHLLSNFRKKSPVSFNGSSVTPTSKNTNRRNLASPALKSTAKISFKEKKKEKKRKWDLGLKILRLILCVNLIFGSEVGVFGMVFKVWKPKLSTDLVEQSSDVQDLSGRLTFLKTNLDEQSLGFLEGLVNGEVSNCSNHSTSSWGIHRDVVEEVGIWGWPLQTSGLLIAALSSRLVIVLSGRLTECVDGSDVYLIREVNDPWFMSRLVKMMRQFWCYSLLERPTGSILGQFGEPYKKSLFFFWGTLT
ncbi:hypothetical protein RJ641_035613 [Dillenia turbinata]|uniref:Uncharacterized protein n=1 Tax=Dillenia turbinata TaxID=194707 RepID=A0AAN8VWJ0_9MAGN